MQPETSQTGIFEYLKTLKLERPNEPFDVKISRNAVAAEVVKEGAEQAFISDKSIVSFVSTVKDQNRKDILNSTLLAQLAANKQNPIDTDIDNWYSSYVKVLERIGWVVQYNEVHKFETKESVFEVENVILNILSAAFGANYITLIQKTLDALKELSKKDDGRIKVFERNTRSSNKGCFLIALATEEGGAVALKMGAFLLSTTNTVTKVLFIKFTSNQTSLDYSSTGVTLNEEIYAKARQLIIDKLSTDIINYVAEIKI